MLPMVHARPLIRVYIVLTRQVQNTVRQLWDHIVGHVNNDKVNFRLELDLSL